MSASLLRRATTAAAGLTIPLSLIAFTGTAASADAEPAPTLYTLSNETGGNRVLAFSVARDGSLTPAGAFASGGNGSGGGLGSQGSVVVTDDHRRLFAVNAGSDSVSMFTIRPDGSLRLRSTAPSGGQKPISVTVHDDTLVVLNGGDNTVSSLELDGRLRPTGSTRSLTGKAGAQVSFTPDGERVVVTEKMTNSIDVFALDDNGVIGAPRSTPSTGVTPFGFAFDNNDHLIVSNAAGGAAGASSLTSYTVADNGTANVVSGPVADHQAAACWVVISENGRYAYTTNTASGTISGYRIGDDGGLTLLDPTGVTATVGTGPIDAVIGHHNLFTVNAGSHTITTDHVNPSGSLTPAGTLAGLPASTVGLAIV